MSTERFAATGQTPIFQKLVHVDFGEQRAYDAALGRPRLLPLPPLMRRVPFSSRSSIGAFSHIFIRLLHIPADDFVIPQPRSGGGGAGVDEGGDEQARADHQ
jgi:hypothetical protein